MEEDILSGFRVSFAYCLCDCLVILDTTVKRGKRTASWQKEPEEGDSGCPDLLLTWCLNNDRLNA